MRVCASAAIMDAELFAAFTSRQSLDAFDTGGNGKPRCGSVGDPGVPGDSPPEHAGDPCRACAGIASCIVQGSRADGWGKWNEILQLANSVCWIDVVTWVGGEGGGRASSCRVWAREMWAGVSAIASACARSGSAWRGVLCQRLTSVHCEARKLVRSRVRGRSTLARGKQWESPTSKSFFWHEPNDIRQRVAPPAARRAR